MELWILFGTFSVPLLIGTPVAFCLGAASFATVWYIGLPPVVVFQRLNSGVSVYALMAIPFFIYAGDLMVRGDIARRLVALASGLVGHFKGGLGQVNILTASVHVRRRLRLGRGRRRCDRRDHGAADEGERGYGIDYAVNITVTSSIIALMLPPSHNMIIYSIAAGGKISIADLFTAGIVPGLILALSLMVAAYIVANRRGYPTEAFPGGQCWARCSSRRCPA
jgi:TRAP-type mannitol/chloroaromatic compound transport system permease large subunit